MCPYAIEFLLYKNIIDKKYLKIEIIFAERFRDNIIDSDYMYRTTFEHSTYNRNIIMIYNQREFIPKLSKYGYWEI